MDRHNYSGRGYADDWSKTSYNERGGSNHVHRPIIVDAEGRKKPFIPFTPNPNSETFLQVSAQRIVEHVHTPIVVSEYKYSSQGVVEPYGYGRSYGEYGYNSPKKLEPVKSYGEYGYSSPPKRDPTRNYGASGFAPNDKWGRSTSPIQNHPPPTEYRYQYPTSKGEYIKDSGVVSDTSKWGPQVHGTDYGYGYPTPVKDSRVANNSWERPPTRPNILNSSTWRRPLGQGDATGYGNYNTSDDWSKPNGNSDYYQRNDKFSEPIMPKKEDSWERPGQRLNYDTPLSGPTNDIGQAVEMLKEAVKTSAISPIPVVPRRDTNHANVIDSKEAAKRYGNFNLQGHRRPYQTEDTAYTGVIDSEKAKMIYGGAAIPKYNQNQR